MTDRSNPNQSLKVFLCHSSGDKPAVRSLYQRLQADGLQPWLDEEDLLPGQDWDREIRKAVRAADVVLVCLSKSSISKAGYVQKEIKHALDIADEQSEDTIFLIPVKLEECDVPDRLSRWHWVNLFEEPGYARLIRGLQARANALGKVHSKSQIPYSDETINHRQAGQQFNQLVKDDKRYQPPSSSKPSKPQQSLVTRQPVRVPKFVPKQKVRHAQFGEGIVVSSKAQGDDEEVTVAFIGQGVKRLLAGFSRLEIVVNPQLIISPEDQPPATSSRINESRFIAGQKVNHDQFGNGIIVSSKVQGDDEEVVVAFIGQGVKRLLAGFSRLRIINDYEWDNQSEQH